MGQNESRQWASSVAAQVGKNIQRARKVASMSAQDLSNACESLGYPIPRSTIANIESGRKETVALQELLVIAEALNTPPLTLIYYPYDAAVQVEKVPGKARLGVKAAEEFAFDHELSGSDLARVHETVLSLKGTEESAELFLKTATDLLSGRVQSDSSLAKDPRISGMLDDSDLGDLARQEAEVAQKAVYHLARKASKLRGDLAASGVALWPIPDTLTATYAKVSADFDAAAWKVIGHGDD